MDNQKVEGQLKIAYIMSRFPHLPETFILREMIWIERFGWQISLYPLICQQQSVMHEEAREWLKRANCLPYINFQIIISNLVIFARNPLLYLKTWLQMVKENVSSPKFLFRGLVLFPKIVAMARTMQCKNISHIHAHYATHPGLAAWIIHRLTGISYSITVHAHDIYVERPMLSTKIKDSLFIIAISQFNREFLTREVGEWAREKIHVVHCGIDPQIYHKKNREDLNYKPFKIISIGSLQPYKGLEYLIEACSLINFDFRCEIIGEGQLRSLLEAAIQRYGLQDKVALLGAKAQHEVAQSLKEADCYVQPSVVQKNGKMEGIPVALMEAMSMGIPVVASRISGIPELVQPGISGTLVSERQPVEIAEAISFLHSNPEIAFQMADQGKELVMREFNLDTTCSELSNLFYRFIKSSR